MTANARDWQTRIRLWAATFQGIYAFGYILYYAMGVISPEAIAAYLRIFAFARFLGPLVILSLLTHIVLGLWKIYQRNTFRIPLWELCQILLGLSVPFFLFPHIADSYSLRIFFGVDENYVDSILLTYPDLSWQFIAMVLSVSIHAQIGTHAVFRLRRWYPRLRWFIAVLLSIIPLLAVWGYLKTGADFREETASSYYGSEYTIHVPTDEQRRFVWNFTYGNYALFAGLYLITFAARAARLKIRNRNRNVTITYSDGRSVQVFPMTTLLEASRIGGIPHASICGGRGRCTTCRVRVDQGADRLSPVGEREGKALMRIGAGEGVRLACQTECVETGVSITLLLPPDVGSPKARGENRDTVGRDVQLAVMFADIRGFTSMSEGKLPYDVVFILNQYFNYIGEAIERNGGIVDKFLGDGVLAYFGLGRDSREACRSAIAASKEIASELEKVNGHLRNVLSEPLKVGIGIHFGDVVLGEVGYGTKSAVTIIGDTVNTASRLEALNKRAGSQLIMSSGVVANAGYDLTYMRVNSVQVRGRSEPLRVYVFKDILAEMAEL
ncbi:MAG TPA: adenylate/guanylate cyclase domain-containing protein [Spirochaetia bacterium]|nr:adenylate/guanylate cyclase domain-containing protein [Spirochaetia bacterium]